MTAMELRPDSQGKVRDIYDAGDSLLMVASDRISAFDYILPDEIPYKGEVLSRISAFWFEKLADVVPNHLVSMDPRDFPAEFLPYEEYLSGRAMLVRKAEPIKIECVVRGYLTGSIKEAYDATGEVDGVALPAGLVEASPLPEPLFTPSTKADVGDHDENISYERCVELIGEDLASQIRDLSISLYTEASSYARTRGIIIADTKFEFGIIDGRVTLIDECLTPIPVDSGMPPPMRRARFSLAMISSTCAIGSRAIGISRASRRACRLRLLREHRHGIAMHMRLLLAAHFCPWHPRRSD